MANLKVRHLVKAAGHYYWQPTTALRQQGWKARRLPDSLEAAIAEAEKINGELDKWRLGNTDVSIVPVINSVSALIAAYKLSSNYTKLADNTREGYDHSLALIEKWAGNVPLEGVTRKAMKDFFEKLSKRSEYTANATIRVLRLLFNFAVDRGDLLINPASRPGLLNLAPRDEVWTIEEIYKAVEVADERGYKNIGTAIMIAAFMAQREGDILKLNWSDYQSGAFLIRQNKTGAYIAVPVHPLLKQRLDTCAHRTGLVVRSDLTGKQYTKDAFCKRFDIIRREVCKEIPAFKRCKFMDLRRTAIVRLAEAGCTEAQISAVSGHKIDTCRRILETYLPRNSTMAKAAIDKLTVFLPAA